MNAILKVINTHGAFDIESFTLSENEGLTITADTEQIRDRGGVVFITATLNEHRMTFALRSEKTFTLSPEWLNAAGEGELTFAIVVKDRTERFTINAVDYKCDPIIIRKTEGNGWEGIEAFRQMQTAIATLKGEVERLAQLVNDHKIEAERANDGLKAEIDEVQCEATESINAHAEAIKDLSQAIKTLSAEVVGTKKAEG